MTLREWFAESETHYQAIYWSMNGRRYVYYRNTKSKMLDKLFVDEEVELRGGLEGKQGAWLRK